MTSRLAGLLRIKFALPALMLPLTGLIFAVPQPASAPLISSAFLGCFLAVGIVVAETVVAIGGRRHVARRQLLNARKELADSTVPAFVVGPDGAILFQNQMWSTRYGDQFGTSILEKLGYCVADPKQAWHDIRLTLAKTGCSACELGEMGRFSVIGLHNGGMQLWQIETAPDPAPAAETSDPVKCDFEWLPVPLLTLDARSQILRINAFGRDLLEGAHPGQLLATHLDGLGREIADWVSDVSSGRMAHGSEVLHLRSGNPDRFIQVSLTRGTDDQVTAVLSDASAMKTLEAQFVQSQKMQAIGQLAGGIAHDFNNLLTAITGHCDLLMLRHDQADPDFADLDQISQNANRAAALVRQLLAFSRKQTLKPQIVDLRDSLSDLTHLLNRLVGERVYLTFDHDPSLRMIRADRRQLEQVIMNLVVNARDAMANGGGITIATDNLCLSEATRVGQANLPAGEYVRVQVRDQGCGIPAEELSKIFEPFFTTKKLGEGTGLGLSTAYGIVKQTGGYIFCDSTFGEGSTFSLIFPAHDPVEEATALIGTPPPQVATRFETEATVLLVEDEAPVRAFASRALKLQGIRVIEAASAEEALSLLADHRLHIDVFVTDVVMPGMDGPAWVRTALRDRPQTRVIFMSGYAEDVFSEGHVPIPNSVFLPKPFSLTELTALVAQQLRVETPVSK
ncbi:ATP-binding protein [Paracoccus aestuariivivens]|uniref:histidine kinase n=1 Tax=Paracoccus aestuariivivens TaxID=1820333 RepID=A0A6L6J4F7_9RHOB|nr:ATP-binding protein [Paracoccus aestuariivivens]MTH76436.1 response regulator [Paracoccus aestuariivivens]